MQQYSSIPRSLERFVSAIVLAATAVGCASAATEPSAGTVTARVDRARGVVLITNERPERVLVGIIGRAMAAVAFRAPCGNARLEPRQTTSFPIPPREADAIVFYCVLPLPIDDAMPTEETFLVNLDN